MIFNVDLNGSMGIRSQYNMYNMSYIEFHPFNGHSDICSVINDIGLRAFVKELKMGA